MKIRRNSIFTCYEVDEVDSTNTYLKNHYQEFGDDSVLIAKRQTAGRGRFERTWLSDNDLCFSILFKSPHQNAMIAPLAVVMALEKFDISSGIKWPNDVYVSGEKICGILIEDLYENEFQASIVGIGINQTNKPSVEGVGVASFKEISNNELLDQVLHFYEEILNWNLKKLKDEYLKHSLIIGKTITYHDISFQAMDVQLDGSLVLKNSSGIQVIRADEIHLAKEQIV